MTDDERARIERVPWPLVHAAAENPRMQSALHRYVFGGRPLPEVLRAARRDLAAHVAEMCELAGVSAPDVPPWPEGPAAEVTPHQVDALLGVLRLHSEAARAAQRRLASAPLRAFRVVLPADAAERAVAALNSAEFTAALRDAVIEWVEGDPAPAPPRVIRTGRLR